MRPFLGLRRSDQVSNSTTELSYSAKGQIDVAMTRMKMASMKTAIQVK
jgi:hypothetical protein